MSFIKFSTENEIASLSTRHNPFLHSSTFKFEPRWGFQWEAYHTHSNRCSRVSTCGGEIYEGWTKRKKSKKTFALHIVGQPISLRIASVGPATGRALSLVTPPQLASFIAPWGNRFETQRHRIVFSIVAADGRGGVGYFRPRRLDCFKDAWSSMIPRLVFLCVSSFQPSSSCATWSWHVLDHCDSIHCKT